MFEDGAKSRIGGIQQLHEEVFDLDVVVSARKTQARRGFQRFARGVVQLRIRQLLMTA